MIGTETIKALCGSRTARTEAETEDVGESLAYAIKGQRGAFVALSGELGAGKTAFVRGMARVLSPGSVVRSPTYTVVNEYTKGPLPLYHFDLYRITGPDDLWSVGYHEYLDLGISVAEWAERAGDELPIPRFDVAIDKLPYGGRVITVSYIEV